MTEKEIDELSARVAKKMTLRATTWLKERAQPTLTSGFDLEVLRLTAQDVKWLQDCGVRVE